MPIAVVAKVEGYGIADGDVELQATATIPEVIGQVHAGGLDQADANAMLSRYCVLCILDRAADGVFGEDDLPVSFQQFNYAGDDAEAIGWDGGTGNLLRDGDAFEIEKGKMYFILALAQASEGTKSASLTWPDAEGFWALELLGLTADGLGDRDVGDYEVVNLRRNRIDPPLLR